MKTLIFRVFCAVLLFTVSTQVSAQGFLKKISNAVEKVAATPVKESDTTDTAVADSTAKIKWDAIPVYTLQQVIVTDAAGQPLLNEDGTSQIRVFLIDQFGNRRSKEAVKAQQKKLWEAVGKIAGKVGGGALVGGLLTGDVEGAVAGAATGAIASADDIEMALAQKKSLKQQKKLLEVYEKNFTDEGVPVDAKADLSKIKDLNLSEENTITQTAEEIKKELESEDFNTTDDTAWEI